jgi:hypothetical protein
VTDDPVLLSSVSVVVSPDIRLICQEKNDSVAVLFSYRESQAFLLSNILAKNG